MTIIASLNLAAGVYTRGLVKNEEDEKAFSSSMLSLSTVCISFVFVIYLIFHRVINSFSDMSTYLMAVIFLEIWVTAIQSPPTPVRWLLPPPDVPVLQISPLSPK